MLDLKPTVFVVDDDVSVRDSLQSLIKIEGWEPRTFASAEDFLSCSPTAGPSCLILDVELPDLNGLDLQTRLAADRANMPIIFITGYGDIPMTVQAMKAGAAEFLTKPCADDVLVRAIEAALERSRAAVGEADEVQALRDRYQTLTPREREVVSLVIAGLLNKQIAGELDITVVTVKVHRGRAMEKMQVRSVAELVRIAAKLGLAPRGKR
jgi:FixJ family two-component response regulator